jgi:hypothetical protein
VTTSGEAAGASPGSVRDWPRVAGLFAAALGLSVVRPSVLVAVPFLALLAVLPTSRLPALLAGFFAALLAFGGAPREGLWYVERGWALLLAGWFAALTLRWPALGLFPRAAASGALAIGATILHVRPGAWEVLDSLVAERLGAGLGAGLETMRLLGGSRGVSPALTETVQRAVDFQAQVFPALLGLASLASLGLAWWLYVRLAQGRPGGLMPVREFRFNDHFVWIFIAGVVLLLAGWGDAWGRAGSNAVVFMGALYTLRGVAVVLFATGGVSFFGAALLLVAVLFLAPVLVGVTLFIGLGDTWLDLRTRIKRLAA